jgi:hypothetical protein
VNSAVAERLSFANRRRSERPPARVPARVFTVGQKLEADGLFSEWPRRSWLALKLCTNREQPKYLAISAATRACSGPTRWFQVSRPSWSRASSTRCGCSRKLATWLGWPHSAVATEV